MRDRPSACKEKEGKTMTHRVDITDVPGSPMAGVEYAFYRYDVAGHAFQRFNSPDR